MLDHPGVSLILVISNIAIVIGSLIMGVVILPRLRRRWNLTIAAGSAFFVLNGAQHLDVTIGMLFASDLSAVATSWHLVVLRVGVALSLSVFVLGILRDVRDWKTLQDKA